MEVKLFTKLNNYYYDELFPFNKTNMQLFTVS
jgi:hypothetical protein